MTNDDLEHLKDQLAEAEELLAEFVIEKNAGSAARGLGSGTAFKGNGSAPSPAKCSERRISSVTHRFPPARFHWVARDFWKTPATPFFIIHWPESPVDAGGTLYLSKVKQKIRELGFPNVAIR